MTFEEFIMQAREMNASDIHLTVGAPTVVRVNGELRKYTELSDLFHLIVPKVPSD